LGVCLINHGGSNAPTILESNMRDQTAALKYLAEKQYQRGERQYRRGIIMAYLFIWGMGVILITTIVTA
jgi:hypothetical protein